MLSRAGHGSNGHAEGGNGGGKTSAWFSREGDSVAPPGAYWLDELLASNPEQITMSIPVSTSGKIDEAARIFLSSFDAGTTEIFNLVVA